MKLLISFFVAAFITTAHADPYVFGSFSKAGDAQSMQPGIGWRFGKTFSVESFYLSKGDWYQSSSATLTGNPALPGSTVTNTSDDNRWKGRAGGLVGIAAKRVSIFEASARMTVSKAETQYTNTHIVTSETVNAPLPPTNSTLTSTTTTHNGSGLVPGIGIGFALAPKPEVSPTFQMRVTYDRLFLRPGMFGPSENDRRNLNVVTVGMMLLF